MAARKRTTLASQTIQPEDEIAQELGTVDGENGETIPEEAAKAEGAVNVEAAQSNRRRAQIIARKRGGEKHVPWNESNACLLYDDILMLWPANSIGIMCTRLTGTPASMYILGKPRSGIELYAAIKNQFHGRREETEYMVAFRDEQSKFDRGRGRLTIPSTVDEVAQAPQPMPPQFAGGPPNPWQAQQLPSYPGAQPQAAPPDPMQLIMQRLDAMQAQLDGRARQAAAPAPQGLGAPPAGLQPTAQPGVYFAPGIGYVQAVPGTPPAQAAPTPAPAAAPPPLTPADQFRQATALVTGAVSAARDMASLLPAPIAPAAAAAEPAAGPDEGPTKVIKLGDISIVQNTADGSMRPAETFLANSDKIMSWVQKQREDYQAHVMRVEALKAGQPVPAAATPAAPSQQMPAPNLPLPR